MVKTREVGRKKLNQATRYLTIVLGVAQSMGITAGFNSLSQTGIVNNPTLGTFVMIAVILTAGTMFVTWMGEQITEKGIGNGVSMIIFAGLFLVCREQSKKSMKITSSISSLLVFGNLLFSLQS